MTPNQTTQEQKKEQHIEKFGICSCCGGEITMQIERIGDLYFLNWFCSDEKQGTPCQYYKGTEECDCLLDNAMIQEKREKFRSIIKERIVQLLDEYGQCGVVVCYETIYAMQKIEEIPSKELFIQTFLDQTPRFLILTQIRRKNVK